MQSALKKQELEQQKVKELELIAQKTLRAQEQKELEFKRYIIALVALIIIIVAFFLFYYYKKKREDKLTAYNDNLRKYFLQKENEVKLRIAEKILDTVASGNLSPEDQRKLIEVMHRSSVQENPDVAALENETVDIEVIEQKPKD